VSVKRSLRANITNRIISSIGVTWFQGMMPGSVTYQPGQSVTYRPGSNRPPIGDLAKKLELVKTVTDAAVKAYGLPGQAIVILIKENHPENVGIGGKFLVDRAKGSER
jgi:4-oxalocrotonate tautomerase